MKTIGLLGGMSWESTLTYYRRINELVRQRLGGLHSARIVLNSVDFAEIEELQRCGQWDAAGSLLAAAARAVEDAGADFLLLCTNTMHKVAPAIEAAVSIPLLHIADPTAAAIRQAGLSTVGLLGTRFTMEQDFYRRPTGSPSRHPGRRPRRGRPRTRASRDLRRTLSRRGFGRVPQRLP
jgi:aspartate racemase